jgi:hypothetical protein
VEQPVRTGQRRREGIEVLSGISAGDIILRQGNEGRAARIEVGAGSKDEPSALGGRREPESQPEKATQAEDSRVLAR